MAKHKKPRTSSCFLGCFGISKVRDQTGSRSNSDKKKSQRWLPLPRAWSKKSGAKTVPVDLTAVVDDVAVADVESEKAEARRRYDESRLKSKSKARRSKSSPEKITGPKRRASEAAAATPAASEEYKPREIQSEVTAGQKPVHESRSDHPETDLDDRSQAQRGLPFRRTVVGIRTGTGGSSQPGSPVLRTRSGTATRTASFPAPLSKKSKQQNGQNQLDAVVGVSIVMVVLVIMVLCGRVCAILCTSAWLYFIPQMRSMGRSDGGGNADPDPDPTGLDLSSEDYKKKVVLEGLLERNRRSPLRERGVS